MSRINIILTFCLFLSCSKKAIDPDKDVLKVGIDSQIRSIDPRYAVDANSQYLENLINCSLISFDKKGQIENRLAKKISWITPNQLEVEINSASFSDGSDVKISDIKATFDFFSKTFKDVSARRHAFKGVDRIEVLDKKRLRFYLKKADGTFPENLIVGILPESLAKQGKIKNYKEHIGCGSFKVVKEEFGSLELERVIKNEKRVNRILLKIVKDESTRLAKLLKGELHIVQNNLSREQAIEAALDNDHLNLLRRNGLNTTYIGFNFKDSILKNRKVRQAINISINREEIIKFILKDFASVASSLLTPGSIYKTIKKAPKVDLKKAKQLLDEAGYQADNQGNRLKIEYKTTTNTIRVVIAKAIAAQLKKIGIVVTVKSMDWGKFKKDVENGQVQMWGLTWVGFKDPDIYRYVFATESFPPNGGNRGWFSSPPLDELLSIGKQETNIDKRKLIYKKVEEVIQRELPYSYLWHQDVFALVNSRVKGFELYADGRLQSLENVSLE